MSVHMMTSQVLVCLPFNLSVYSVYLVCCYLWPAIKSYLSIVFIYFFILVQKNVKYVEEFQRNIVCVWSEQHLIYLPLCVDYLAELATLCQTLLGLSLSQERHLAIHSPLTYIYFISNIIWYLIFLSFTFCI